MKWIERIDRVGTQLVPFILEGKGSRREGRLGELRSTLHSGRSGTGMEVIDLPLRSLRRVDTGEYLRALGFPDADEHGHEVFCLDHKGRRLLIPAAVLLSALVSRISCVGDLLLSAASLDQVASPVVTGDRLWLEYHPRGKLSVPGHKPCVFKRFLWLTCFPSARAFWASIYTQACKGTLGLELPNALVSGNFYVWKRADGTDWVSRMSVHRIEPLERALPFAAPYAPACFEFETKRLAASANIRRYRAQAPRKRQEDIPAGPDGWSMTDEEWREVVKRVRLLGRTCRNHTRATLDVALLKFATGRTWAASCSNPRAARSTYGLWSKDGRWTALKSALRELRAQEQSATGAT